MENKELEILKLADYYEIFEKGGSSGTLIVNKKMKNHQAMFGFVTLSGDKEEARMLFASMEKRAKELGYRSLVGPINYCTWMSYRWAISRFDLKFFPDCDNPPFYNDIVKDLGYKELYTYRSAVIDIDNPLSEMGEVVYRKKLEEGYRFKLFEGREALTQAKEIYAVSKDAFSDAYLYSELPYEAFEDLYMSWIKKLDTSLVVAYKDGEAAGYVFGYENPAGEGFISKTSAVKKEYQKHKLYIALLYLGSRLVKSKGYHKTVHHFQCEQKATFKRFENAFESNEKRYAVYIKEV